MATNRLESAEHEGITGRKARHIDICLNENQAVQGSTNLFEELNLVHQAAPEVDTDRIALESEFLGHSCSLPFFISCMTGGSDEGFRVNRNLARAAGERVLPVGLGSIRVLHRHPELFEQFHIKPLAGDAPVIANLGGVQVRDLPLDWIDEILKQLEVQALAVHLNPGQELFQDGGDRDFRGVLEAFEDLTERLAIPVVVKETGFGINPQLARELVQRGAAAIDVAGAGGTNWLLVESVRSTEQAEGEIYRHWGIPTAAAVAALHDLPAEVYASGGIRNATEIAKAIALGATSVGMALPFIQAESEGGVDGIHTFIDRTEELLRRTMTLVGAAAIAELRRVPLILSPVFQETVYQLRHPGEWRSRLG